MKTIVTFIFFLLFCLPAFSQSSVWLVEKNDAKIYVGGSVHILRDSDYPLPKEFDKAFDDSEILVLEVNFNDSIRGKFTRELIGLTLYPNDKSLKTELSEEVYNELNAACDSFKIPIERFHGYKPIMLILTLERVVLHEMGISEVGVDKHFLNKANEAGKVVLGLDNYDSQINLIATMGDENEDEFVRYYLKDLKYCNEIFEELILSWRNGKSDPILEQINDYKFNFPQMYNSILVERNRKWIPQIESFFETNETEFVIFGAGHLYGEDGVLQLLENKGYKISQL